MLSSGMKCYHLGWKWYHLELMASSGTKCYHLGQHVIIWDAMLSSGANVIIWKKMISSGANVIMVLSGANVIIWCYHVMLSSGMITHPFFIFPENFTHSLFSNTFYIKLTWLTVLVRGSVIRICVLSFIHHIKLKGPKHDQTECGFLYINQTSMGRWLRN